MPGVDAAPRAPTHLQHQLAVLLQPGAAQLRHQLHHCALDQVGGRALAHAVDRLALGLRALRGGALAALAVDVRQEAAAACQRGHVRVAPAVLHHLRSRRGCVGRAGQAGGRVQKHGRRWRQQCMGVPLASDSCASGRLLAAGPLP
jgi:hypothetical protein